MTPRRRRPLALDLPKRFLPNGVCIQDPEHATFARESDDGRGGGFLALKGVHRCDSKVRRLGYLRHTKYERAL